ncbi:MAG: capsid protein [Nitrospira sp. SG-bin2]|uniref:capsid protein n=1 Tax=Nitrospira cf. moscoviensis SBR1015 TaxID=96242 RepID=UPI000A0DC523|nr:capsid protein [Nitrospira cf. moscoviensis SBR1015]OQW34867.1 MAG: capsid protein [Nitrospira sp. SG-bin2]
MANATVSRLGQQNATGDALALFLKVFANEILTAFAEANIMFNGDLDSAPMHMVRTIESGKSAQFPATWKAAAEYHTPGAEIVGAAIKHNERTINIDGLLISHAFISNLDEAMNHYDVRSIYTTELGRALAREADKNLLQLAVLCARTAATITGAYGGTQLTNAAYDTTADAIAQGIYDAGQAMDEKDIPQTDRYCVLRPKHYNLLVQSSKALHRDWNAGFVNGNYADGKVFKIDSVMIKKSNHLPNSNLAQVTGTNNTYHGDFTNTVGVVFHKTAIGTVKLMDLALESAYDIRRQGTLFVAKYAMGHGILRPESAVELKKA